MKIQYLEYCDKTRDFVRKSTKNNVLYKHLCDLKEKHYRLNVAMFLELDSYGFYKAIKDPQKDWYYLYNHICGFLFIRREKGLTGQDEIDYLDNAFKEKPIDETTASFRSHFTDSAVNFSDFSDTLKRHQINHLFLQELYGK